MLLAGLVACSSGGQGADDDGVWIYDPADAPPGVVFESTELHDPEFEDYVDSPIHYFEAAAVDAAAVLDWYRDTLVAEGWRSEVADDHQLVMSQVGADRRHYLVVETYTAAGEQFATFSVEEYQAEG